MTASPERRLGRNDRCWCGSGQKYKNCHLEPDEARVRELREKAVAEAEQERSGVHDHICKHYHPQTHKVAAIERPDFLVTVRNLGAPGPGAWLHIDSPVDLGRDQLSVDRAMAYLKKNGVLADFRDDPNPTVIAATQDILDRMAGRGVFEVKPSGARLRRYGRTELATRPHEGTRTAYLSGRGSMHGIVYLLLEAARADGEQLGVVGGILARVWPVARVIRELVRNNLALVEPLRSGTRALIAALVDQLSQTADHLDSQGGTAVTVRTQAALPYLVGLREALVDSRAQLEGMGLDDPSVQVLTVQLEAATDAPAWLIELADLAPEEWDSPDGYRAWVEAARSVVQVANCLDTLADGADVESRPTAVEDSPVSGSPPYGTETDVTAEAASREFAAPVSSASKPVPAGWFAELEAGLSKHAARRQVLTDRLAGILDRRASLSSERRDLATKLAELDREDERADGEQATAVAEIDAEAEAEESFRHEALATVLAHGAARLRDASAEAPILRLTTDAGGDSGALARAEQSLREFEEMERRGLLDQLPAGVRSGLVAGVEDARATLRQALGGRDPLSLPVVISAFEADEALTVTIGTPIDKDEPLQSGSLETSVAAAIAAVVADLVRSVPQIDTEEIEHEALPIGGSLLRVRFSGPSPVTAEDCAEYCASLLKDAGEHSAALRAAGVAIETRVEPNFGTDD